MPRGGRLSFALVSTAAYAATPVEVTLSAGGSLLGRATILGAGEIATELDPATTLVAGVLRLRLKARPQTSGLRARLGTALGPSGLIEVAEVLVASPPDAGSGVVLAIGESRAWPAVARACQVAPAPDPATGWPECVEAPRLELAVLPTAMPAELVLRFGPGQPVGSVVASGIAGTLRRAIIGPGSELRVPLVDDHPAAEVPIQVALDFDPEDPFTTPAFALAGLSLSAGPVAPLEPGAEHRFEGTAADQGYLDASWQVDEAGAHLTETHGRLDVAISPAAGPDAELQLVLAPMGGPLTDAALNVAVSDAGAPLAVAALRDQQMMVVPLAEPLRRGARRLELDVHLALAVPGQDASALRRGAVTLLALRLVSPSRRGTHSADMQPQAETLAAEILAAGVAARDLRERAAAEPSEVAALAGTRARIVAAIEVLADKAALAVLLNRETLDALLDLGAFAATVAESRPRPVSPGIFQDDVAAAARSLSLAILTTPPWQATEGAEVAGLCEALAAFPVAVARYLAATDWAIEDAAAGAYRAHVLKLFAFARASFAGAVTRPRLVSLAERLLGELRPHPLLFAGAPMREVAEALGEAAAARLVSAGRRLGLPRPARRRTSALRLGVLLRNLEDTPETRIFIGTLGVLPPEAVQVTVVVHEASRRPVDLWPGAVVIDLDGLSVNSAVEAIRAEALDLLLLGAFVAGFADLAAIVSHRLAPLQVASTAVAPMTTGLASFDLMLCDAGSMPADGGADYSERLAWSPVPVQRFPSPSHPAADREAARDLLRARLGLAPGAVVLVSGAVEGKIGAELIRTWSEILAAAPEAVLVLYPFAPNWRMRHARGRFVRHLAAACAARSVAADRVRVLDSLSRSQVEDLLSGADLYLDSFPYAGATTVVEALHCSLPAVALAGNTQRGLQGAAWLRAFGLPHLVADDPAGYSARAAALARDAGARRAAAAAIRPPAELAPEVYGPALARFLRGLAGFPEAAEPRPRHIFHHMPKAAGTTCRDVFASWFELRVDDREPWSPEAPPPRYPPASIAPGEMLCGHFNAAGYSLSARYPEVLGDPGWRLITFLRDPLEAAISYHAFERRHRPRWDPSFVSPDLDAYLEAGPRHLGEHLGSVDDDWRAALERYWFVGTVDRLGECLRWLALALDKPDPGPLPRLNSSDGCGRPSACAVRAFTRCRPEEFEIWRAAAARCDRLLASNPRRWRA